MVSSMEEQGSDLSEGVKFITRSRVLIQLMRYCLGQRIYFRSIEKDVNVPYDLA